MFDKEAEDFFDVLAGRRTVTANDSKILHQAESMRIMAAEDFLSAFLAPLDDSPESDEENSRDCEAMMLRLTEMGLLSAEPVTAQSTQPTLRQREEKATTGLWPALLSVLTFKTGPSWQFPAGATAVVAMIGVVVVMQMQGNERAVRSGADGLTLAARTPSETCKQLETAMKSAGGEDVQMSPRGSGPEGECVVTVKAEDPQKRLAVKAALLTFGIEVKDEQSYEITVTPRTGIRRLLNYIPGN